MSPAIKVVALLLATAGSMPIANGAEARPGSDSDGMVTVCSRYGKGCVSGPTRQGRFDREVRLPGGTWIGCKRDCRQTLREESIDFFETLNERAPGRDRR